MRCCLAILPVVVGLFISTSALYAQESGSETAPSETTTPAETEKSSNSVGDMVNEGMNTSIETTKQAITRPWQWLALDIGPASLSTTSPNEVSKQGTYFSLKTLIMFDFDYFVAEGGFGLFSANLSGDFRDGKQTAEVTTALTEAGARWVINPDVQLGGFAQWIFGKASDFGPVEGANTNNLLVGIQASVEPSWFDLARGRITLNYIFDKTIVTRNFTAITFGFQMGLPWLDDEGRWMWDSKQGSTN